MWRGRGCGGGASSATSRPTASSNRSLRGRSRASGASTSWSTTPACSKHKQIYDVTPEDVEYTLRVNLIAPARLIVAALPPMLRQGEGFLVNVSSVAGKIPPPRETVYAASKFGLTGLTEGLWLDLAGSNVHATVVHVGPIDTEIWEKTDTPTAFRGKKLPPAAVSAAIFRAIERRLPEVWVPGWMRVAWWLRLLAPGLFRAGAARYDPIPPDVLEAARRRARGA